MLNLKGKLGSFWQSLVNSYQHKHRTDVGVSQERNTWDDKRMEICEKE